MKRKALLVTILFLAILMVATPVSASHNIDVPLADQGDNPWCGPVSIVMILQYWNINASVDEAGESIDPEKDGCYSYELVEYLEGIYIEAYELDSIEELKRWIDKDHPVVVLQWSTEAKENGHFRVVTGYDSGYIYINDPNGFKTKFTYETFFLLWTRYNQYGLTISPVKQFITDPYTNRTVGLK